MYVARAVMSRSMLLVAVALMAALAAGVMLAPRGAEAQAGTGRVRVMHASPDTPPVDIFVDGQKAVTALAFPNATGYVALPAGGHNVKVFVSPSDGRGTPALEANLEIVAGKDVTVLATGLVGNGTLALTLFEDDNRTPAANNAHVRLIHASPDAPPVNVAVAGTDTNVFTGVAFRNVSPYVPVPAGSYNLEVKVNATGATVLTIPNVQLQARTVYTVVAVGLAGNGTLRAVPLVDAAPAAAAAPAPPRTGDSATSGGGNAAWMLLAAGTALVFGSAGLAAVVRRSR